MARAYCMVPLSGDAGRGKAVKISIDDYAKVIRHRWYLDRKNGKRVYTFFGGSHNKTREVNLSDFLACKFDGKGKTTSKYRGVRWQASRDRWEAYIRVRIPGRTGGKRKRIGGFVSEIEAARAYDKAARLLYGNRAITNF